MITRESYTGDLQTVHANSPMGTAARDAQNALTYALPQLRAVCAQQSTAGEKPQLLRGGTQKDSRVIIAMTVAAREMGQTKGQKDVHNSGGCLQIARALIPFQGRDRGHRVSDVPAAGTDLTAAPM